MVIPFISIPAYAQSVDVFDQVCKNENAVEEPELCKNKGDGSNNDAKNNPIVGPNGILTKAINILSFISGIIAVLIIIVSGFRIITSNGDSNTISTARQSIIYSLAGLVVIALSQVMVIFVLSKIT